MAKSQMVMASNRSSCPLCGEMPIVLEKISSLAINDQYERFFGIKDALKTKIIEYLKCNKCGLRFFNPMQTGSGQLYEDLQRFDWYYFNDKWEYQKAKEFISLGSNVLEIGAGNGAFGKTLKCKYYTGLEYNDLAIKKAKFYGVDLLKQSVENHAIEKNVYDVVVSFQVLEHIERPMEFIYWCLKCLNRGYLILAVPNHHTIFGSSVNNLLDVPPHHVSHWSEKPLHQIAKIFNLEIVAIAYEPMAPYHRLWAKKIVLENQLRTILNMRKGLIDNSILSRAISFFSSKAKYLLPNSIIGSKGHTLMAIYKK